MRTRQFVRQTTNIPFKFKLKSMIGEHEHQLKNISQGGLCFRGCGWIEPGTELCLCIPFAKDPCHLNGKIAWCHIADQSQYEIGIQFEESLEIPALQQIDQIELYKRLLDQGCGERVTSEDAGRRIGAIS
ncbi:MAG: PilZ domain-containing protein [Chromatiaceae bacterium]|nr:PilZ domain-containing protein [Chromatiaceae bacterium]